jgi:Predicted hydrolases or acyltransferases (alpha/beta hydrolase superfamily)
MPAAPVNGIRIHYEVTGEGPPILFIHELAGDFRSWEPQVRALARHFKCITYSARGYLPSDIPNADAAYSQRQSARDAVALLDHLGIESAHIVGLSMGGFVTTQIALDSPHRARSLTIASCGSGSEPHLYLSKQADFRAMAQRVAQDGTRAFVEACDVDPTRQSFKRKDPKGWNEFLTWLGEHDAEGLSLTLRNVQGSRPSLWDFEDRLKNVDVPSLILCGDQDAPCLQPSLFLARTMPNAQLAILPGCGHILNLEEPALFNYFLKNFIGSI